MTNLQATEEFQRITSENRVLNRIIEVLFSGRQLDAVLRSAAELIGDAHAADACFVYLLDSSGTHLILRAATGEYKPLVGKVELAAGEGIAGWVTEHREAVIVEEDKAADPRYRYVPELGGDRFTSMISLPLISARGQSIGAVNIHTAEHRIFADDEVAFLKHVAFLVAAAIEHAALFRELARKESALQVVVAGTIEAQEEERRRVAMEIHDGVMQQLISIWYRMNAVEGSLDRDPLTARRELETAKTLIDEALDEARAAIYDLRPTTLDDFGLGPALEVLVRRAFDEQSDVLVSTHLMDPIPSHVETALYRLAQEAINNIRKHAGPCSVRIELRSDSAGEVEMTVNDTGEGFDFRGYEEARPQTSYGLLGMRERVALLGGCLDMFSSPGAGTSVHVRVPLDQRPRGGPDLD